MKIALVGDYNVNVTAHRAIPSAIELSATQIGENPELVWLHSEDISHTDLTLFDGFWLIPASPYKNMQNVLTLIQFAREQNQTFLGTCGGYQHAALEFARNVLGFKQAGNAEVDSNTTMPLISALVCRLSNHAGCIKLNANSKLASIYNNTRINETYNCGFGVNLEYVPLFDNSALQFIGTDTEGDPKALELTNHPFFIGTAFQPERFAFKGAAHPLIDAFLKATQNNG